MHVLSGSISAASFIELGVLNFCNPTSLLKLVMVWVTTGSDSLVLTVGHYGPVRNGLHCKVVWLGLVLLGKQIGWFGLGLRRTASFPFTSRNKLSSVEGLQLICWSINFRQHASKIAQHVWFDNGAETIKNNGNNGCSSVLVWKHWKISLVRFFRYVVWCGGVWRVSIFRIWVGAALVRMSDH